MTTADVHRLGVDVVSVRMYEDNSEARAWIIGGGLPLFEEVQFTGAILYHFSRSLD